MNIVPIYQRLGIGIVLSLLCGAASALAIEQDQPFLMESWTLAPGSVFEILAVSDVSDRQVAWSLTKADGSFVQADRGPLFRERFAEAGDFLLRGEVAAADQTPITQRTFAIHIVPGMLPLATGTGGSFIAADPPFDANGISVIGMNLQTILLHAQPGTVQLSIDVHSGADGNGDGDSTNDNDSRGTFFESDGSALRLWFTDGVTERTLTVRGNGTAGPATQTIRLYAGSAPAPVEPTEENPITSPSGLQNVLIEDRGNGAYGFSIDSAALSTEGRAILLYWDFGDGQQSMLDRPVHTYARNGQYTVNLQARDLATTEEILRITGLLPVNTIQIPEQTSSMQQSSAVSSKTSSSTTLFSRFSLRSIATIGGGLLLAILVGFAMVTIIGKIVQRKLDREPPPPEGKPAKKSPPLSGLPSLDQPPPLSVATDVAPPMAILNVSSMPTPEEERETPDEEPVATLKDTVETGPSKLSELTFKEEEAPGWLKQGHEEAEKRGHTVSTALPTPEPEQDESRPLPPWLEPTVAAPAEMTPPPAPTTQPVPAIEPVVTEPAPTLAPAEPPPPPMTPPTPVTPAPARKPSMPIQPPIPTSPAPTVEPAAVATSPTPAAEKREISEAERERRRKKRARYRQNKKVRESTSAEATADRETAEQSETPQEPSPAVEPQPAESTPAPPPAKSTPTKKQESPAPQAHEQLPAKKAEETDAPIAIIRADNISQNQQGEKKS
ncbi:MAG: PKD domain-containing protein [Candidatus Peribacteraceae bacterium]|nr:PKD domain-containing protein [Candidatus Peribacteraceae bacterium]